MIEKLANENIFSATGSNNFKFSEFKHASVKIINPITARGDGISQYKYAIMEPAM